MYDKDQQYQQYQQQDQEEQGLQGQEHLALAQPAPEAAGIAFAQFMTPAGGLINVTVRSFKPGVEGAKELLDDFVDVVRYAAEKYDMLLADSEKARIRRDELRAKTKAEMQPAEQYPADEPQSNPRQASGGKDKRRVSKVKKVWVAKRKAFALVVTTKDGDEFWADEKHLPDPISLSDFDKGVETEPPEEMTFVVIEKGKYVGGFSAR